MARSPPAAVRLVEVGPRDGLQNEPTMVPAAAKAELIARLAAAGLRCIEATSFVSPKAIPKLADAPEVMRLIKREPGVRYPVLCPNMKGYEAAAKAGAEEIAVFTAASDAFNKKNTNATFAQSLERFRPVVARAKADGIAVRGYLSCVVGCPYQGEVAPAEVARCTAELLSLGCYEVSLGDTVGVGTPGSVRRMLDAVLAVAPAAKLAGHFHDTYGQALANITAAMDMGVSTFDCSVGGLGGCPYAKGASGNVATEDVVYMLNGMGVAHGVDLPKLLDASEFIARELRRPPASKVFRAMRPDSKL